MKFSMILAVLPVALAATGTLKARDAAREAASIAARQDACAGLEECLFNNNWNGSKCDFCPCHPEFIQCQPIM
ncbi:hypothetical protein HDV63DRAFT_407648 [Trichoderma sp. SZMC 28014]